MKYEILLNQIKEFVFAFFKTHADDRLSYHNTGHTESVVSYVIQIANHYQLNDDDFFAVCAAAWFHDTGYVLDAHNHEEKSIAIASDFFKEHKVPAAVLSKIKGCINSTKMPQQPTNLLEKILCDADLFHLGTGKFTDKSKQLRKEVEALSGIPIDKSEWRQKNAQLIQGHQFHTDYCQLLLNDKQQENLQKLIDKQKKDSAKTDDNDTNEETGSPENTNAIELKKGSTKQGKGVETMFRITASNQQKLSYMADSKAHIMISVNSIIISLLLSLLLRKIDEHPHQVIPAIVLLTVNLVTIVFAILATRPNVAQGTFTQEDMDHKSVNLLFFGNYFKMTLDKYNQGMVNMMNDSDFLYASLIRDIYAQGVVLGRKYHLLRMSYNVFMYGLIISVIAFVLSTLL